VRYSVLGSGSKGNAIYVESGRTSILIDAGFSGKELAKRLALHGRELGPLNALFLTHEHGDHIQGAGVISRRCSVPVYANHGTFKGSEKRVKKLYKRVEFETGTTCELQDLEIRSFRISHDTLDPVGFLISDGKHSVACCTDTGKITHLIANRLSNCDGLILEFNHDLTMLKNGPYPFSLQQRVRSNQGHLANNDAAEFLKSVLHDKLQQVILAHLSETNNRADIALQSATSVLPQELHTILSVAPQDCPTKMFTLA
jgi:phosphoribosyl 1,2-cyclic phosphodiesterase